MIVLVVLVSDKRNPQKQAKKEEMQILMLVLNNSGKTTILKKFNGEDITEIAPTLGSTSRL